MSMMSAADSMIRGVLKAAGCRFLLRGMLLVTAGLIAGCGTAQVHLDSIPPDAAITVNHARAGTTPATVELDQGRFAHGIVLEREGYAPDRFEVTLMDSGRRFERTLKPIRLERTVHISSDPPGAAVAMAGKELGKTPLTHDFRFERAGGDDPWPRYTLRFRLPGYATGEVVVDPGTEARIQVALARVREDREFRVSAFDRHGSHLAATVWVDGRAVGETPVTVPLTFRRDGPGEPWPEYALEAAVPGLFQAQTATLGVSGVSEVQFVLEPVREIPVTRYVPRVVIGAAAGVLEMVEETRRAMLDASEPAETSDSVAAIRPITNFGRQDLAEIPQVASVNSFGVSADGTRIVYALTREGTAGNMFSNLYLADAAGRSGTITRLTHGDRFFDSRPVGARDGSDALIFQSNRSERDKLDLYRILLDTERNRLAGGITRITSDDRLNYRPSFHDSAGRILYLTLERDSPLAFPRLRAVSADGRSATIPKQRAEEVDYGYGSRVLIVLADNETGQRRIYSLPPEGGRTAPLLSHDVFPASDCFHPRFSPDGSQVLFVSNREPPGEGIPGNNIYLVNSDGSELRQLTRNPSDDIHPEWSPVEPGVIFFLSNRGGAYNVWRMKLADPN